MPDISIGDEIDSRLEEIASALDLDKTELVNRILKAFVQNFDENMAGVMSSGIYSVILESIGVGG
jgi:predicted transcriptional regulator